MPNRIELVSDANNNQFSLKLNGAEVERVKSFVLKGDANHRLAELSLVIDVDSIKAY